MRILWFTTSPSLAEKKEGMFNITGGWIKSEENALKEFHPEILLGVVFLSKNNSNPYEIDGNFYFPVKNSKASKLHKLLNRTNIRKSDYAWQKQRYLAIIRDFQPDLIHIHGTENNFGAVLSNTSVPVILSIQGLVTVCAHKYFSGLSRKQVSKGFLSVLNKFLIQYNDYQYLINLEKYSLKQVRFIFGRTHWDRKVTSVLAPGARFFHIDRVLRRVFYDKAWYPSENHQHVLITTLRSSLFKGFEVILEAADLLQGLGVNFKWQVAGLNKNDLLVRLTRKKLNVVEDKIVFLGKLSEKDLVESLLSADIYIQTSHIENSPNGVAEALALGMPVIASFAGGTSTLVTDREDGILVQDGDPWVLAGAILELWNNRKVAIELGKKARKNAMTRHKPSTIADKIASAYQEVILEYKSHE